MQYNPEIHHRRSIRLKDYDYSQSGAYFVTVCTKDKECLLGEINNGNIKLNEAGKVAFTVWSELTNRYSSIELDEYIVMPNHFHGIVLFVGAGLALPDTHKAGAASSAPTLGDIMRVFKSISAIKINRLIDRENRPLWQRNYYEHILRNEIELEKIREYIINNPLNWAEDENYTELM